MKRMMGKIVLVLAVLVILGQAVSASAMPWCGPARVVKTTTVVRSYGYPYCAPTAVYYPSVSVVPVTTVAAYVAPVTYVYPAVIPAPVVVPRVYAAPVYYPAGYCY
jgi:hypothetical protein